MTSVERAEKLAALGRPTVWYPMVGPIVEEIQQILATHGLYSIEYGDPPGRFSLQTEAAVRGFQSLRGLRCDAVVGPKTWAALVDG